MPRMPNHWSRSVVGRVWLPFSLVSLAGVAVAQTKQSPTQAAPAPASTAVPLATQRPAVTGSSAAEGANANEVLTYTFTVTSNGLTADGKANDFEEMATEQVSDDNARITYFEPTDV